MQVERQHLQADIAALQAQRGLLGNAVVDALRAAACAKLAMLASGPGPAWALKQVSILFLGVVGFTTISPNLDPQAISARDARDAGRCLGARTRLV